jgi:hypothetical protein
MEATMVEAIRDQWAVVLAVVVLATVLIGLWRGRERRPRAAHGRSRK